MKARFKVGLSNIAQTAFDDEVNRQLEERSKDWYNNIDALILFTLHDEFGFGKERLKRFLYAMVNNNEKLISHYQIKDSEFVCKTKLKEIGIDVEKLNQEITTR
ncbi:MAG: hypothetical protein J6T96_05535 [Bacteroidales bacterium]|nr:hypothetical protein [Bacteroidales bacterium]